MAARIKQAYAAAASVVAFVDGRILAEGGVLALQSQRAIAERYAKTAVRTFTVSEAGLLLYSSSEQ